MFYYLKLTALVTAIFGFILAFEINKIESLIIFKPIHILKPSQIFYNHPPFMNLSAKQKLASFITELDLIWLESVLPKSISHFQIKMFTLISDQKDLVKLYFSLSSLN